ncbi:hypothetical protein ANRL2_03200 [Anaerolineae bacterium]|nr:hypothetical protein ANRL2_03200 [Anaerolineae bacterium]
MLGKITALFAWIKSASSTDTVGLSQLDVYVRRCEQFPGLPLPSGILLTGPAPVRPAVTDRAQGPLESFQPRDAALVPDSSS